MAKASRSVCLLPHNNGPSTQPSPATVKLINAGTCIITARQSGSADYAQSKRIKQTVTITG